jgi:hypothetical protein
VKPVFPNCNLKAWLERRRVTFLALICSTDHDCAIDIAINIAWQLIILGQVHTAWPYWSSLWLLTGEFIGARTHIPVFNCSLHVVHGL